MRRHTSFAKFCSLVTIFMSVVAATSAVERNLEKNPSTRDPDNALKVTFAQREKLRTEGDQAAAAIREKIKATENPKAAGYRTFEEIYALVLLLDRIGYRLAAYGEPASVDFQKRSLTARKLLVERAREYAKTPAGRREADRRNASLERNITAAKKRLARAQKHAAEQRYFQALEDYFRATDQVVHQGLWYYAINDRRHSQLATLDETRRSWEVNLAREINEKTRLECQEVIKSAQNDARSLLDGVEAAAAAIGKDGKLKLGDKDARGPDAVQHFGNLWIELHGALLRAHALAIVFDSVGGTPLGIDKAYIKIAERLQSGLANIIAADAQRASPEEVRDLYADYLDKLTPLIARAANPDAMRAVLDTQLNILLQKSPELLEEVRQYRECMEDVLRWRQRTVAAYMRTRDEEFPALTDVVSQNTRRISPTPWLLVNIPRKGLYARTAKPIPELIEDGRGMFLNKKVRVDGLRFRDAYAVGQYTHRSLVYVLLSAEVGDVERKSLQRDLLSSGDLGAPTLEARYALHSALNNDLQVAGGTIDQLALIGWTTRFATLTKDDRGLVRLGPFANETELGISDLILLHGVTPAWVAHKYYFTIVPTVGKGTTKE